MRKLALHWQILIALVLAVLAGLLLGDEAQLFGISFVAVCDFAGRLFLNGLKMLVVPLVASAVIVGIAGVGTVEGFGRLGLKTILYYISTTFFAVVLGLLMVNLIRPGVGSSLAVQSAEAAAKLEQIGARGMGDVAEIFLRLVPPNVVASAAEGDMLGLIFFSLLFGIFAARLRPELAAPVVSFWRGVYEVMLMITDLVMRFAPIGVFALVAKVVATTGMDAFAQVALFAVTVLVALAVHLAVTLPLLLWLVGGVNPLRHFRAMAPALLTAFSTASSSATLPLTMECVEKRAGVSNRTTSFVLPLGATINMDGTALYECVAAVFIAQAYGIQLSFTAQSTIVILALLTSIGVAGIPAASLVAIVIILNAVGLPAEGIGLILAVDRVLDMCRTGVNIFSDSCGAVIIGRSEGERGILQATPPAPALP
jgi:Na+/H+-dicarboxylate symporter